MPPSAFGTRPWLSSYPPGVPADVEVPDVALTSLLDAATRRHPHGAALTYLGRRFTWAELDAEVDRFARGLTGAGVGPGDRVAVLLPNCPQNVVTFWAALRVGAVVVELNMLSPAPELQGQLADCGARLVVTLDQAFDVVAQVRDSGVTRLTDIVVTSMTEYRPLLDRISRRIPLPGAHRGRRKVEAWDSGESGVRAFRSLLAGHTEGHGQDHSQPSWPLVDPRDPAVLQYTNGTTGAPRAAVLSHRNLVANALQCRAWLPQLGEGSERVVAVLPLHHVYGLMLSLVYPTAIAATVLLLPRFDLEELLEVIEHDRPGLLPAVPPILQAIVDDPRSRSRDLSGLRLAVSGAMRLPVGVAQRFERLAGCPVVEGYGTAETSPVTHVNPVAELAPADPSAAVARSAARPKLSIGLPLPSTEARIVALEDPAMEMPVGQPGELAIRGPQVFRGYWRDEEQTRQVLHDGWLLSGDVARMEPDGLFY
ncbi:MAG: AMP-binding protein, partial [Frankiaceae bacterium]